MRVNWGTLVILALVAAVVGGVLYARSDALTGATGAMLLFLILIALWSGLLGGGGLRDR